MFNPDIFKLNQNNIYLFLICLFFIFAFTLQSNFFIFVIIFSLLAGSIKAPFHLAIFFVAALFLTLVDFDNFKNFILLVFSTILLSVKFSEKVYDVLKIYSYVFLFFIIYILFISEPKYGSFQEIFLFQQRLWLILPDGREFNPNPLGLICSLVAFGFLINRKYIFMSLPLFLLLLTQSRAAILFFLIAFIIFQRVKVKNIIISFLVLIPFVYIILTSPLMDRFSEDGENGRIDRILVYSDVLRNNYILGYPIPYYDEMIKVYGTLDNMYLLLILNYGLIGIFFLIYVAFMFLLNDKDEFYRVRLSLFIPFLIYGIFEGGVVNNYLTWIVFSMCFSSFNKNILRV